ncbi:FAD/NAD(P)-binding domain-containing protein [Trametes maxima]|nr:FAD/NAD(P)-binding domain-containing protein [Trametes maxima]
MTPLRDDRCEASVVVIGAGIAGLVTAHTLLRDGFSNVHVLTRDTEVGGTWAGNRIYPNLYLNNVHGEYRLSHLDMPSPPAGDPLQGRLTGRAMSQYFKDFASAFLRGKIQFGKDVKHIRRHLSGKGWQLDVHDTKDGTIERRDYARVVLCTGGSSTPKVPEYLNSHAAAQAGFKGPVIHTAELASRGHELLSSSYAAEAETHEDGPSVVVVGGGKSAQDMCAFLANEGRKVTLVCHELDAFIAGTRPLPESIRRSRFLSLISPYIHLRTGWERFLHTTWLGKRIVQLAWYAITEYAFRSSNIPAGSPLRNTVSPHWHIRFNDEGYPRPNAFHALVLAGKIQVLTHTSVARYGTDGKSVVLDDGRVLQASALALGTGYKSSWEAIFDENTLDELGLSPQPAEANTTRTHRWEYTTLSDPPPPHPDTKRWSSAIYRGIVPAKNIMRRDLAINGIGLSINIGYTAEVCAHWISSYFMEDPMRLPESVEAAVVATEREAAWLKQRYPQVPSALNPSYTAFLTFFNWPQHADDLLEDMGLRIMRSGGNALTWPFKVVQLNEIINVKEERDARRAATRS